MWRLIKTRIPLLVLASAVVFLIYSLAPPLKMFFEQDWKALFFPYALDYGEGPLLDQTLRLSRFQNIYHINLSQPPYTISNYPPVFPLTQVPFLWIFGPALWYGRLLSILSILASAILIGLTIQIISKSNLAGVTSGLVFLAIPYVFHWSPLNRIDNLALALSWAGLYVIIRGSSKQEPDKLVSWPTGNWLKSLKADLASHSWITIGAVFLIAAIFTRQSYALAAPLAAFIWLVHLSPRRRAFHLAIGIAGTSLVLAILLTLITMGGFYIHIVTANINAVKWSTVLDFASAIWINMRFLVLGAAVLLLTGIKKSWRVSAWWLVAPYLIGSILSGLTIGKVGSNVNYLLEFSAALSLVTGAGITWLGKKHWLWRSMVIVLTAVQVIIMYNWSVKEYYPKHAARMLLQSTDLARLNLQVKSTNGIILADEHMTLLPLNGKNIYFQPFEFKQMVLAGLWNQQPFVDQIKRKEFALILLYQPTSWDSPNERWTEEQINAIYANYARGPRLADTIIYRPEK